ncbi:diacylglycerol O-acyltransferase 1 [Aspergillus niger]|uniref:Diacylglycerol O-acyltransferase n=1 Tax=Aspergillus niger TaxID=5061 RepID=A0A9W6E6N1_ASPNG|nr:diacylglycerol O-acyltransferase 1 [Aspergillus niger]
MSPSDTPPGPVPFGQENAALQPTPTEWSLKRLWNRTSLPYKAGSSVMPGGSASQAAQETTKESRGASVLLPTSGDLSGRCDFLRSLGVWSIYASYFPARLHRSEPLLPTRKYIFGYHPHGIISHGAFAAFATEALGFAGLFPGITNTLLTLDSNFRIPFYREYALAMGIASVSRESCENLLSKGGIDGEGMGRAVTIVIGGARESLDALPHTLRLVLKRRKGFIKLAIHTGADLVPVLAFGENDLYEQVRSENHPVIHKLQMLVKHTLGFTIPLFHARGVFNYDVGLMPYRRPLNIVVGRPIHVVQQRDREKIDDDYINHLHSLYVQELERIWEEWKDKYARDRTSEIEIVA